MRSSAPRNKFNAIPTVVDGIRFASLKEGKRYGELLLLKRAGEIAHLVVHPCYPLKVNDVLVGKFHADFEFLDTRTDQIVSEDVKSLPTRTEAYKLRAKLFAAIYGREVVEI